MPFNRPDFREICGQILGNAHDKHLGPVAPPENHRLRHSNIELIPLRARQNAPGTQCNLPLGPAPPKELADRIGELEYTASFFKALKGAPSARRWAGQISSLPRPCSPGWQSKLIMLLRCGTWSILTPQPCTAAAALGQRQPRGQGDLDTPRCDYASGERCGDPGTSRPFWWRASTPGKKSKPPPGRGSRNASASCKKP
jgi:hypothetical protein